MLLPTTFAGGLLLLLFLGHHVAPALGARAPGRGQSAGDRPVATGRGKFSITDKTRCTWRARDVGDSVKLAVKCEDSEARAGSLACQYTGRPQRCAGYLSDDGGFWKQVARALKRLGGKVCADERALVRAGMCKRAPRDAHFKLDASDASRPPPPRSSTTTSAAPPPRSPTAAAAPPPRSTTAAAAPAACAGRADHRGTAEEYCSSSWASVCAFLLSMVQSDC